MRGIVEDDGERFGGIQLEFVDSGLLFLHLQLFPAGHDGDDSGELGF